MVNPASSVAPPDPNKIFIPDTSNWKPPISIGESYIISRWVSVKLPNEIFPSKHQVPSPLHIPHSSYSPKQSSISSQIPSSSESIASPKQFPLQSLFSLSPKQSPQSSWSLFASWPVLPSEHTPQSSKSASPKHSPAQSWSILGIIPVSPPEQISHSSISASP